MKTYKQFNEELASEGFLKLAGLTALALPAIGAVTKKFLKPKTDKKIEGARKNLPFGGEKRSNPNLNKK